jgi:hypothetical protein
VCHCCGEQVYHERRALTQHLRARHCLSLAEYHRLYARLVGGVTVHYYDQKKKDVIKDTANMKKQRVAEVEPMEPLLLCCPFPSCQFAISPKVKAVFGVWYYKIPNTECPRTASEGVARGTAWRSTGWRRTSGGCPGPPPPSSTIWSASTGRAARGRLSQH